MSPPDPERKSVDELVQSESGRSSKDALPLLTRVDSETSNESGTSSTSIPLIVVVPEASRQANIGERLTSHDESVAKSARRKVVSLRLELSTHLLDAQQQSASSDQSLQENTELILASEKLSPERAWKPIRRSFVPQLIETSRRSRRAGDTGPALTACGRTDVVNTGSASRLKRLQARIRPAAPLYTALVANPVFSANEARKLGTPNPRQSLSQSSETLRSYKSTRSVIESSESEPSGPPSRNSVPSSSSSIFSKHATRAREGVDEDSSGHLLALAAKAAERQLRERALAAFPNNDCHQPVHHYIDRREIFSGSCPGSQYDIEIRRRASTNWELKEIQKHHEKLETEREREKQKRNTRRRIFKQLNETPWAMPVLELQDGVDSGQIAPVPVPVSWKEDDEMEKMRKKARPPMLGGDIDFPRCPSPDQARFDVTQGSEYLRQSMCYLTQTECEPEEGLWSPPRSQASQTSLWSQSPSRAPSKGGLWGGSCVDTGLPSPRGPTGIMTPCHEVEAFPESGDSSRVLRQLPPSPPPSNPDIGNLDEQLDLEQTIESEFDDAFVTQVYNYLSIGYPAVAHDFDEELSKISGIPIRELRQDDDLPCARGYIRLGEGEHNEEGVTEDNCLRWKAMRLYIQEWARQQPTMVKSTSSLSIGLNSARKGSWAW
jgi:hypothetical protein